MLAADFAWGSWPASPATSALNRQGEAFIPAIYLSHLTPRNHSLPPSLDEQLAAALGPTLDLERELGGGGVSRVYLARDRRLGRPIVVKLPAPALAPGGAADPFEQEILLAAGLQHPHIVPLLAAGEVSGLPYFTMPFIEGESLRRRLDQGGPLLTPEAVRLFAQVASALSYAHARGLVHRDIKPTM